MSCTGLIENKNLRSRFKVKIPTERYLQNWAGLGKIGICWQTEGNFSDFSDFVVDNPGKMGYNSV
jgi:hypothetical protein